ncbi:m130 [Muromegalovirus G4]|uniref:M130 n=1 Tax=Muromegalovirus G4 TaxID=524650 RepID=A0A7D5JTP0_MUHV1|nr:m130 [Muromegalovirus G4]QNL29273.1 m130 [Muromegalovirus G4]
MRGDSVITSATYIMSAGSTGTSLMVVLKAFSSSPKISRTRSLESDRDLYTHRQTRDQTPLSRPPPIPLLSDQNTHLTRHKSLSDHQARLAHTLIPEKVVKTTSRPHEVLVYSALCTAYSGRGCSCGRAQHGSRRSATVDTTNTTQQTRQHTRSVPISDEILL